MYNKRSLLIAIIVICSRASLRDAFIMLGHTYMYTYFPFNFDNIVAGLGAGLYVTRLHNGRSAATSFEQTGKQFVMQFSEF